jgi:hypothetical protein
MEAMMSEAAPKKLKVASMRHAYVSEDGSLVELEFVSDEDATTRLSFDAKRFEQFASRAVEMFTEARNRRAATTGHLEIRAVLVVNATAQAPVGGDKVILFVRSDRGTAYHFAMSPEDAEKLGPELFRAAESAKKQASQSRH